MLATSTLILAGLAAIQGMLIRRLLRDAMALSAHPEIQRRRLLAKHW